MRKKFLYYTKETLLLVIVITLLSNIVSFYKSSELNKDIFKLSNIILLNGVQYQLDDEKPTLVHIWATWCPTCKLEASNIQRVSKTYNVLTIAVNSGSNEEIEKWLLENSCDFNVVNDKNGLIASKFNVDVFPTTLIYNKDKELVFSDVGYTSTIGLYLRMWWASL